MNALILLFYRIVTFFTRVPKKTRVEHKKFLSENLSQKVHLSENFINDQSVLSDIPYGKGNMGLNGCGPVAVFNALQFLSNGAYAAKNVIDPFDNLSSIIEFFEHKGATLNGKFGTSPLAINMYLKEKGFETKVFMKNDANKLNDFSKDYDAFISIIFNNAKAIKQGLHFICTKKNEDGSFTSHNPLQNKPSLYETLNSCSVNQIRHVYTIGIKK